MSRTWLPVACTTSSVGNCQRPYRGGLIKDEITMRQRAISLRFAGQPVKRIRAALGRTETWFHQWWRRYLEAGVGRGQEVSHFRGQK